MTTINSNHPAKTIGYTISMAVSIAIGVGIGIELFGSIGRVLTIPFLGVGIAVPILVHEWLGKRRTESENTQSTINDYGDP